MKYLVLMLAFFIAGCDGDGVASDNGTSSASSNRATAYSHTEINADGVCISDKHHYHHEKMFCDNDISPVECLYYNEPLWITGYTCEQICDEWYDYWSERLDSDDYWEDERYAFTCSINGEDYINYQLSPSQP